MGIKNFGLLPVVAFSRDRNVSVGITNADQRKLRNFILPLIAAIALISCTLAPKYQKPAAELPFADADQSFKTANISWQEFFKAPELKLVIELALKNNQDFKVANLNIESAKAAHNIVRSSLFPAINASASGTFQGVPKAFALFMPKEQYRASIALTSYEIDFFGKMQSLKKSALEDFLATKSARDAAKIALITEAANAYIQVVLDQQILDLSKRNLENQTAKTELSKIRYENGIDSRETFLAQNQLLETARINYEIYEKTLRQDKNALMLLTGTFDEEKLPPIKTLAELEVAENLLEGVPSENLLLRPDIEQAEHDLKSANADIGAARANFFPSISISGSYGYASRDLSTLASSRNWSYIPQVNLPIFAGGKNWANLKLSNNEKEIRIAKYQKAIQTAFTEVKDALSVAVAVTW